MSYFWVAPGVRFNDFLFTEPVPLRSWHPPGCAGILALLARNQQWAPKPFEVLYFGEFGNNAINTLNPRVPENTRTEDLYVSVLPLPFSTVTQRKSAMKELIAAYNPTLQASGSPASTADLAQRVDELEARQQEQHQQILSLLTYIGKLFEPLPAAPRRPIGFLPHLAPAGPPVTETES